MARLRNNSVSTPKIIALGLCAVSSGAFGSGFQLMEQSVTTLGRAHAGGSLAAEDASAAFYNPADMVLLDKDYLQAGATYIDVEGKFGNDNSVNSLSPVNPTGPDDDGGEWAVVPNLYAVKRLDERTVAGFAVTTPFGLETKYDNDWVGRYHAVESSVATADFNASVGYRLSDIVNLGFGVSYQYIDATLSNMIFTGGPDLKAEVTGDDWSWGYNAGITWDLDHTRFSLTYRSEIEHDLKGDSNIDTLPETKATANIELPATTTANAWHRLSDQWEIMASLRYTEWDSLRKLVVNTGNGVNVTPLRWDNTWAGAIGVNFKQSQAWTLRSGIGYDATPIEHQEFRTPRIPDGDRIWLSFGATWHIDDAMQVDMAYTHLFIKDISVNTSVDVANGLGTDRLDGGYDKPDADLLGVQLVYKF